MDHTETFNLFYLGLIIGFALGIAFGIPLGINLANDSNFRSKVWPFIFLTVVALISFEGLYYLQTATLLTPNMLKPPLEHIETLKNCMEGAGWTCAIFAGAEVAGFLIGKSHKQKTDKVKKLLEDETRKNQELEEELRKRKSKRFSILNLFLF